MALLSVLRGADGYIKESKVLTLRSFIPTTFAEEKVVNLTGGAHGSCQIEKKFRKKDSIVRFDTWSIRY